MGAGRGGAGGGALPVVLVWGTLLLRAVASGVREHFGVPCPCPHLHPHIYRAGVGGGRPPRGRNCVCVFSVFLKRLCSCACLGDILRQAQHEAHCGVILGIFCVCEEGQNWGHTMMQFGKWGPEQGCLGAVSPCGCPHPAGPHFGGTRQRPAGLSGMAKDPEGTGSGHLGGSLRTADRQTDSSRQRSRASQARVHVGTSGHGSLPLIALGHRAAAAVTKGSQTGLMSHTPPELPRPA